jgi:hypothetical protein
MWKKKPLFAVLHMLFHILTPVFCSIIALLLITLFYFLPLQSLKSGLPKVELVLFFVYGFTEAYPVRSRIRETKSFEGFFKGNCTGRSGAPDVPVSRKVSLLSGARRARPGGKHSPPVNPLTEGYLSIRFS